MKAACIKAATLLRYLNLFQLSNTFKFPENFLKYIETYLKF